jgi:hypothetical protein
MQAPVQRSVEAAKSESQDPGKFQAAQQLFADRLQKETDKSGRTVKQPNKSEKGMIDKDGRFKNSKEDLERRKRENEKKQAALRELQEERRLLDIRI